MGKLMLAILVLSASSFIRAMDITTTTGEVLKDATIYDANPVELVIGYTDKDGWTAIKPVPFTSLSDDLKKQYGYTPEKAKAYEAKRGKYLKEAAAKEKEKVVILNDMPKSQPPPSAATEVQRPPYHPPHWQEDANPYGKSWTQTATPDSLAASVQQLTSYNNTDAQTKLLWQKLRNKRVNGSGVVLDVRKINWSSYENYWDGWGVAHIDTTTGWEVLIHDPQIHSKIDISLLCYNYDTAKNLQKGQTITFSGNLWRFHGHALILNPVRFD